MAKNALTRPGISLCSCKKNKSPYTISFATFISLPVNFISLTIWLVVIVYSVILIVIWF